MLRLLSVLIVFLCVAQIATAAILPDAYLQKWEASLDGFSKIYLVDPDGAFNNDGDESLLLRSLTKVDAPLKSQGQQALNTPSEFSPGLDMTPGKVADKAISGLVAFLVTNLKVIAVDDASGPFGGAYTRLTGQTALNNWAISGQSAMDIVYFGLENPNLIAEGLFYHDATAVAGDFVPGVDGWNASGTQFDNGNGEVMGDAGDTLLLRTAFQLIEKLNVDGLAIAAPTGTYIANVLSVGGSVRPLVFMDVVGGTEANLIEKDMIKATVYADANNDGVIDAAEAANPQSRVADLVAAIGTGVPVGSGFATLSDPVEFVSNPEPASLVVWSFLAIVVGGVAVARRRRVK